MSDQENDHNTPNSETKELQTEESNISSEIRPEIKDGSADYHDHSLQKFYLGYRARRGELALKNERFCAFKSLKEYPHQYIGNTNRQKVVDSYFGQGKLYNQSWELFYIYGLNEETQTPLILITTRQLVHFLEKINTDLKIKLTIPSGSKGAFEVKFENGMPRPRYLGNAQSKDTVEKLQLNVPARDEHLTGESEILPRDNEKIKQEFKDKLVLISNPSSGQKGTRKKNNKEKTTKKKQAWNHSIKRVQRYLGIRLSRTEKSNAQNDTKHSDSNPNRQDSSKQRAEDLSSIVYFDPEKPAAFPTEDSVVFICVDVEAWERNSKIITEIGFATLDTKDIASIAPGERGTNWMKAIRPRHFRIIENKHYVNKDFVTGCADRFEFGKSEFISLKDAPQVVSSCFKHPFSKIEEIPEDDHTRRKIVLVGHDVSSDVVYLRKLGYDVFNLSNLEELIDTAEMNRYLTRQLNPQNLGAALYGLGITAWNLHNAGNDAVYTLQAMIALAIKQVTEREKKNRTDAEVTQEPASIRIEDEGWSTSGNLSDGGEPQLISLIKAKLINEQENSSNIKSPTPAKVTSEPWEKDSPIKTASISKSTWNHRSSTSKEYPHGGKTRTNNQIQSSSNRGGGQNSGRGRGRGRGRRMVVQEESGQTWR
ncbi:QDE-2 interacting protein [Blumeria hordei DH14]|uniref:QDE-2 interacting protein n=1 Tax=Blumeria graminis f. sp. hordei (strain DH14) TaxID=546991 RepID=N1JCQ1_BLUG1|nr:QDE-2 interacting protein [Blumeria hordei DH14]